MTLKDTAFMKFLIELPEKQKAWATVIICVIIVIYNERKSDEELRKHRTETNEQLERCGLKYEVLNESFTTYLKEKDRQFYELLIKQESINRQFKQDENNSIR